MSAVQAIGQDDRAEIWPAFLSILFVAAASLPLLWHLGLVPVWVAGAVSAVLLLLLGVLYAEGRRDQRRIPRMRKLGQFANLIATAELVAAVASLAYQLVERDIDATGLLVDALAIWLLNILVFAVWYWEFDAGGPHARQTMKPYSSGDFVFPQRQMSRDDDWRPSFVVYLFLAFNTNTAFSPTDTLVLSDWARLLMMAQSLISLITLALLAARAVNTLRSQTPAAPATSPG